jgi:mRNA interferase MazF
MKRGEVWWASLPEPIRSEPGCRRPVLVIQADEFNQSAIRTVICAMITSNVNLASAPGNVHMSARTSGLPKPSVVNVSQLMSMDRSLLTQRVKSVDNECMRLVEDGLRLILKL